MLALIASYASTIYLFLLNSFASFWLSRTRTSASENATELGFGAVNVIEVVKVNGVVVPTQTSGTENAVVLPFQESDITDYTAYSDEVTSAIIRQAFLPSKFAEAMKRYGPDKMADKDEPADKAANRCSIISCDDNTSEERFSEERFFSDGESTTTSSSMTSVGDESETPDSTERFHEKQGEDKIESDLTIADADKDDGKSVGNSHQLSYSEDDESVTDESEDEEFYSFSEDSDVLEIEEATTLDDIRGESKVLSLGEVESRVGDENDFEDALFAVVNDREGDSTPLSSILEKRSRSSHILSDDLSFDNRRNGGAQEMNVLVAAIIQEEVSIEFRGANEEVALVSDGAGKDKFIPLDQSRLSISSLGASEEAQSTVPRIFVQSPSMDEIHHQLTPARLRPRRDDNEDFTEVLEFMQECDLEIPNRFLSSAFEDDESDEILSEDDNDTDNDEYDSFSQARIFMEPSSMPPGSLHLLRVSDDGTYVTIEPFDSNELWLSPFKSMHKVEMIKPAIPTVVVEEMTAKIVESTPTIAARTSFIEEVPIHTECESARTIGANPSMKDTVTDRSHAEAEVVRSIPSIVIQSPSTEDVNIISANTISTEARAAERTPTIVGPSPSIEAIIALLDLPEVEVVGTTSIVEPTGEITDTSARAINAELESTPTTVGSSHSIEAIIALLDLPNEGGVAVIESTPAIVSPSPSLEDIHDPPARNICTEPESVDPIAPAIIVQSPSLKEIFAMPARTREEVGLLFDIIHSPPVADLASILAEPEVEEIESTPSIAPEETPIEPTRIEPEVIQSAPTIVVQSPSMEWISPRPTRPTLCFDEGITELLDFMNEHNCELPMFATFGEDEDEEDEDGDSMESHDLATTSTESLTSLEDELDGDSMKSHDLTATTNIAGMAALTSLEDEWKPIFDVLNNNLGIPFAQGRAFLDGAVEWFENEPKSSWSEESLSQLSSSSSSEGEIGGTLDDYANDGGEVGFDEDEPTVEDKDLVAIGENKPLVKAMGDETLTDEGSNGPIPWTLFRPRIAPEDYLRVPERRYKRS